MFNMSSIGSMMPSSGSRASSVATDDTATDDDSVVEPTPPRRYNEAFQESDVIIHVENQTFHCHSTILNLHSPKWCDLFKENGGEEKEILLAGKEPEAFNLFLDLMYPFAPEPGNTTQEEREMLRTVFDYCEEYDCDQVKRYVLNLLQKVYPLPPETEGLVIAMDDILCSETREGLRGLRDLAMEFVISSASVSHVYVRGVDETRFQEMSGENKFAILAGIVAKHDLNNYTIQQVVKIISK